MDKLALIIAALIYLVLGGFHGVLTLRDVSRPRTFTPIDDSVRRAMQGVPIALHPSTDLWKAWLGFNLSHSLGVMLFGGGLLALAVWGFQVFGASTPVQLAAIGISALYLLMARKFWFSGPVIGTGLATACLIVASVLSQWRAT